MKPQEKNHRPDGGAGPSAKYFVLDTNVLLHNADCIESFADNTVVLPMAVIEELDRFKAHNDELGRNARQVIRRIDALRAGGNLRDGVPLGNGGILRIVSDKVVSDDAVLNAEAPDNRIIRVAYQLKSEGRRVVFVSKDINARLKADALGLKAVDFEKEKVNFDEFYAGYSEATVPASAVAALAEKGAIERKGLGRYANEFVRLVDETDSRRAALGRVEKPGIVRALSLRQDRLWTVEPRNPEQRMAMELLMDPKVQIVTLVGRAGTGKTLIALAAGLENVLHLQRYDRILVSRPIIPMGKDIGYLPGAKEEKLSHWMEPIFDNLMYLLRDGSGAEPPADRKKPRKSTARERIERFLADGVIELEALTYIRGRSIPGQYVIVDEAQNLTPHEVKTIISRAGEGTKMVLTGDPYQIDNPYLDSSSNGLTYAAERLKGQTLHGHVTLHQSERSSLAAIAAEYL